MVLLINQVKQKNQISKYDNFINVVSYIFVFCAAGKYLKGIDCKRNYIEVRPLKDSFLDIKENRVIQMLTWPKSYNNSMCELLTSRIKI